MRGEKIIINKHGTRRRREIFRLPRAGDATEFVYLRLSRLPNFCLFARPYLHDELPPPGDALLGQQGVGRLPLPAGLLELDQPAKETTERARILVLQLLRGGGGKRVFRIKKKLHPCSPADGIDAVPIVRTGLLLHLDQILRLPTGLVLLRLLLLLLLLLLL